MLGDGDDDGDISGCPSYKKVDKVDWFHNLSAHSIVQIRFYFRLIQRLVLSNPSEI